MAATRTVGVLGYELVAKHYYSPIPDLGELPADIWSRRTELPGLRFDERAALAFVEQELSSYIDEYRPPSEPTADPRDYYLQNGFYEGLDAETLYAMVRRYAPSRIVELGSGMSTLVIADARSRNDVAGRHVIFDPYPRNDLAPVLETVGELRRVGATDVPASEFEALGPGDLLFVDTTHTVRIGGDVNRVILEILPRLAPGVIVHIHDIYLPWEYPREFLTERRFFWAEQYLLQAFLAFNDEFRTLFSTHALKRSFPAEIATLIPSASASHRPAAWWLQRVG
jgi:predicted O-methyltransferase YrrM